MSIALAPPEPPHPGFQMKRDREDDDDDEVPAARQVALEPEDRSNGDLNGIRKKFKIPDSPKEGVLSNLVSYGEEEEEEEEKLKEKEKEKVYEYESDEELERSRAAFRRDTEVRKDCPYLDTVNRQVREAFPSILIDFTQCQYDSVVKSGYYGARARERSWLFGAGQGTTRHCSCFVSDGARDKFIHLVRACSNLGHPVA